MLGAIWLIFRSGLITLFQSVVVSLLRLLACCTLLCHVSSCCSHAGKPQLNMSLVPGGKIGFYFTVALLDGANYCVAVALRL